jgi:hypothetical protein
MNEMLLGAIIVLFYVAGAALCALSEESQIWRDAYYKRHEEYHRLEMEMGRLKELKHFSLVMANENRLE